MVLQCRASVAALPEHEKMIFTASVEVSGVGLVGSRSISSHLPLISGFFAHSLALSYRFLRAAVGVSPIGWHNPSSV